MMKGSRETLLISSLILLHLVGLTLGQSFFLYNFCSNTGNYTSNSTYRTNLNTVLSFPQNTSISNGFYNSSVGQNPNTVNAIGLCRGDVDANICSTCLNVSSTRLREMCPNQMEAIGWSDYCMLRYSNRAIFNNMTFLPNAYLYNMNNATNVPRFSEAVSDLLERLGERARGGSLTKFATGNATGPDNMSIYGLVQCTPDLSTEQCDDCLDEAFELLPQCCNGRIGGRVLTPSCNFRYEIGRFYNETLFDAPSPAANGPSPDTNAPPPAANAPPRANVDAPPPTNAQSPPPSGKGETNEVGLFTVSTLTAAAIAILIL